MIVDQAAAAEMLVQIPRRPAMLFLLRLIQIAKANRAKHAMRLQLISLIPCPAFNECNGDFATITSVSVTSKRSCQGYAQAFTSHVNVVLSPFACM
jgi:hypothetical protein